MDNPPSSKMSCVLCGRPVDLRTDLCADENGSAVHETCYLSLILSNETPNKITQRKLASADTEESMRLRDRLKPQCHEETLQEIRTESKTEIKQAERLSARFVTKASLAKTGESTDTLDLLATKV
jgi:hypothetical protein